MTASMVEGSVASSFQKRAVEPRFGGGLEQGLHVEEADLHLLAVEVHAVDRGALAEQQLHRERPGDAVRAAEDQDRQRPAPMRVDCGRTRARCSARRATAVASPCAASDVASARRSRPPSGSFLKVSSATSRS